METQVATTRREIGSTGRAGQAWFTLRFLAAAALMTLAANCFLKYLWWAANYSAWYGIPKYSAQWKAAGARASFYGWALLVLETASVATIYSVLRFRSAGLSRVFGKGVRLVASLAIAILGSSLLAWTLSWIKQGSR
jgi:hypothetical protein